MENSRYNSQTSICLGDKLFSPEMIFEEKIGNDHWVLFAPDWQGLPMVVQRETRKLLRQFDKGRTVSDVIAEAEDVSRALATIAFLQNNGFLRLDSFSLPYVLPKPLKFDSPKNVEVWLHLTYNCNLQCDYCFVDDKRPVSMHSEVARRLARDLALTAEKHKLDRLTVKFAGGEPTLAIPILELFKSTLERQMANIPTRLGFALLTNGTILNQRIIEFLKEPYTAVSIGIDGYGSIHNTFRIFKRTELGSWATIQKNLAILRENQITPFITSTISSETCDSLPQLIRWIHDNGFKTRLNLVRQPDCSWQRTKDTDKKYREFCHRLIDSFGRAFEELFAPLYSFEFVSQLRMSDLHFDRPVCGVICGIGYNHIVIKPDGRIVSCPMNTAEKGIEPQGDLLEGCKRSFPWSPVERKSKSHEDECLCCSWFPVCASGCPITNLRMNGHPFSKSPFCEFYKFLIPEFIRLLAHKMLQSRELESSGETPKVIHKGKE